MQNSEPVLIAGRWRPATATATFRAVDPATGIATAAVWPVSSWADVDLALDAAVAAAAELAQLPAERIAAFLERFAARLEARAAELVAAAHAETGLAVAPRLAEVELPRTLDQLRQAAAAARADGDPIPRGGWEPGGMRAVLETGEDVSCAFFACRREA